DLRPPGRAAVPGPADRRGQRRARLRPRARRHQRDAEGPDRGHLPRRDGAAAPLPGRRGLRQPVARAGQAPDRLHECRDRRGRVGRRARLGRPPRRRQDDRGCAPGALLPRRAPLPRPPGLPAARPRRPPADPDAAGDARLDPAAVAGDRPPLDRRARLDRGGLLHPVARPQGRRGAPRGRPDRHERGRRAGLPLPRRRPLRPPLPPPRHGRAAQRRRRDDRAGRAGPAGDRGGVRRPAGRGGADM
ncbi:MAG: hypothetical protein AVDCRST_MAG65-785, partial [uncultured Solirubrobacteraceae bacterium]